MVTGDEPLLADGLALILGRGGIESAYVETTALAARLVEKGADAVAWAGSDLDAKTIESLGELRRVRPTAGLCLIGHRADARALERLVAQRGERLAFVLRSADLRAEDVVRTVCSVLRGYSTIDPVLLRRLAAAPARSEAGHGLTEADHEVMELVAAGFRNAEIARRLWKSEKAIEKHVGRLFSKFGLPPQHTAHLDRRVTATRIYLASQTLAGAAPRSTVLSRRSPVKEGAR